MDAVIAELDWESHWHAVGSVRDAISSGILGEEATRPTPAEGLDFVSPVRLDAAGQAVRQTQDEVDEEIAGLPDAPTVYPVDLSADEGS